MRLWTIQDRAILGALEQRGALTVDPRRREAVPYAYAWLAARLARVLQGYGGGLPWWLHTRPVAPAPGGDEVVLAFDVPRERVFVLRRWAWSRALLGDHLALSRGEHLRWKRALRRAGLRETDLSSWLEPDPAPLPEPIESARRSSLERLFDPGLPGRAWRGAGRHGYAPTRGTEAVTEELRTEWLLDVREPPR